MARYTGTYGKWQLRREDCKAAQCRKNNGQGAKAQAEEQPCQKRKSFLRYNPNMILPASIPPGNAP
jgi:hypothetical protein